jgi:hypothetical protein
MRTKGERRLVRSAVGVTVLLGVLAGAACGAASQNYYQTSIAKQEDCCDGLGDPAAVSACRQGIPRVDNPAAETSSVNQDTFQCVDRYFTCDAATGHATQPSAQAQLDCITDLGSSP